MGGVLASFLKRCRGCVRNTFGIYAFKHNSEMTVWIHSRMKQFKALKLRLAYVNREDRGLIFPSTKAGNLTHN